MGGWGSGGWNRTGRPTKEQTTPLDITKVSRAGGLQAGRSLLWTWTFPSGQKSSINQDGLGEGVGVRLRFGYVRSPGQVSQVQQDIAVERTPCHFGGTRPWWICPVCGRRSGVLYGWRGHYACRKCQCIRYASQYEKGIDRALRRADKARIRLGCKPGLGSVPPRPKGMHQRTYQTHFRAIAEAEYALAQWIDRILPVDLR